VRGDWRGEEREFDGRGVLELGLAGFGTGDARLIGLGAGPRGPSSVSFGCGRVCVCVVSERGSWRVELPMLWSISRASIATQCGEVNDLLQLQIVGRCGRAHVGSRRGMKKA